MNRWADKAAETASAKNAAFRAWASSLRFSGFTVLIVALVAAGAIIVSPSLSTFVQQRREISELKESVRIHREAVDEIDAERVKWKDPVYVRAQARDRLFYVMPGETQLSVIDDILMPVENDEETSAELSRIENNWARSLAASFLAAGTSAADPERASRAITEAPAPAAGAATDSGPAADTETPEETTE